MLNAKSWQCELLGFVSSRNNETGLLHFTADSQLWTDEFFKHFRSYFFIRYRYLEDATFYRGSGNDNERILCLKKIIINCHKQCPSLFVYKEHKPKDGTTEVLICQPAMQILQLSLELNVYHLKWGVGELFI